MILSFETCCAACSVALSDNKGVIAYKVEATPHRQASLLLELADMALREQGVGYKDLKLLAVSKGPGSFTGIRIGLAAAYGIHLATNIPIVGISTLEAMAQEAEQYPALITLAAGRLQYYVQEWNGPESSQGEPLLWDESYLRRYKGRIVGNYAGAALQIMPNARQVAQCARRVKVQGLPMPLYIRDHDAKPVSSI